MKDVSIDWLGEYIKLKGPCGTLLWKHRKETTFKSACYAERWNKKFAGKPAMTTVNRHGYLVGSIGKKNFLAHRVVLALHLGRWPSLVDHINRNKSDNRICNLREASSLENRINRGLEHRNTSGITGVYWNKARQKWHAQIKRGNTRLHLCFSENLDEAISARRKAEKDFLWGKTSAKPGARSG